MIALPIDEALPRVIAGLRQTGTLVLEAPPGAGKTTRVPPAILDQGLAGSGEIVVLQPRRLAARLAANRVADERGERTGETVGYQVRFEDVSGPKTRIRFLTEGLLTRRLVSDPTLKGVSVVVLDEFHERHLAGDLALALCRRLQLGPRKDLKLVVMSATLDAAPIAAWLGDAPQVRSEGKRFDVELEHLPSDDPRPVHELSLAALKKLVQRGLDGDVLVFLPGASEIRRTREVSEDLCSRHGLELHVLHGDLSPQEQDRAIRPGKQRKVILSTNVAETSVTIEGVSAVIDSGLARVAAHSPWSGMPTLKVQKVAKASAIQRAGRAGRTRAGVCLRLFTKGDFDGRPFADPPEIRRLDLADTVLALRASGVTDARTFPYFEAPAPAALEAAEALLRQLGALDAQGTLSEVGRRMLRIPVHPRQARVLLAAEDAGLAQEGAALAALLGERDLRLETRTRFAGHGHHAKDVTAGPSDLLELLERFEQGHERGARSAGVDQGALQTATRVKSQLQRLVDSRRATRPADAHAREQALLRAVLAGYPDRVAKRRRALAPQVVFATGGDATLDETSVVRDAEWLVCADAEERKGGVVVRLASQVEPEWLLDAAPELLRDEDTHVWNAQTERVERVTRLAYGNLAIDETRKSAEPGPEAAKVLAKEAVAHGLERFVEPQALTLFRARLTLLRTSYPEAGFPEFTDEGLRASLEQLCEGLTSFRELREANVLAQLEAQLTPQQLTLLRAQAPDRVTLPGGRSAQVHYELGQPPWIESRLQDFFGMAKGPAVCGGRVPLVLHLLAPNHRSVQVTTDLAGFWERHYATIRKELMRKYPRHSWPEDGRTAAPPPPGKR
ncbi:MAG: ATP-dependent helicase HrpB [Myxococcaceae bacterium]|nr:ATP-dependent helicase HrpB [Myxococcaceae bacterium]